MTARPGTADGTRNDVTRSRSQKWAISRRHSTVLDDTTNFKGFGEANGTNKGDSFSQPFGHSSGQDRVAGIENDIGLIFDSSYQRYVHGSSAFEQHTVNSIEGRREEGRVESLGKELGQPSASRCQSRWVRCAATYFVPCTKHFVSHDLC